MARAQSESLVVPLFWRLARELLLFFFPAALAATVVDGLELGEDGRSLLTIGLPTAAVLLVVAYLVTGSLVSGATARREGEVPGARLRRLLELPRRLEFTLLGIWLLAVVAFTAAVALVNERPLSSVLVALLVGYAQSMLLNTRLWSITEQVVRPEAVAEFHRYPLAPPEGASLWNPKLRSMLPFAFMGAVLGVVAPILLVGLRREDRLLAVVFDRLRAEGHAAMLPELQQSIAAGQRESLVLLVAFGAFCAFMAVLSGIQLAKRYADAAKALGVSTAALATGSPQLPEYVATDELGDVAFGLAGVFERLKQMALLLRQGAVQLASSAEQLSNSTARQNETLSRQAAALQETEVTAQEIKQTSLLASQKTEGVLQMAEKAEAISRTGEQAVEQGLSGLSGIQQSVGEMASRIRALGERARQIATITTAVKDLADQSNMLALNAAIEAVRSGEHGKGFSVVAREIRTLADQSIQATNRVREILQDVADASRDTVAITEQGAERVQTSLVQVQSTGESLQALGGIVRDTTAAVRQIAAAVGQQNAGIGEIFEAVKDLSRMMDETLQRVQSSEEAAGLVRGVAGEVTTIVRQYGVDAEAQAAGEAPKAA